MNDMKLSGGVAIEFDDSDFEADGFVKVAAVARRIAEFLLSKGAPNKFQAERDSWPHVLTGVTLGALHPVDPAKMQVLSVDHCTDGMIRFDELVAWGQTNKLFEFKRSAADAEEQRGNGTDKAKKGGRPKGQQGELLQKILDALAAWAASNNEVFDTSRMPGQVGSSADDKDSFHWLCATLYPREFRKGARAFKGYRAGRCAFPAYPRKSDFYSRAITHIAQTLGVSPKNTTMKQKGRNPA